MAARRQTMARGKQSLPMLDAAAILAAGDIRVEALDVPEWGGRVYVKTWSGVERELFEVAVMDAGGKLARHAFRAKVAQLSLCDAGGKLLFTADQIEALHAKSSTALDRVMTAADRINTITGAAQDELLGN